MFIAATGMLSPLGPTAATSCAAMRAKISAIGQLPFNDNAGEPVMGAQVAGVKPQARHQPELVEMLAKALADLMKNSGPMAWDRVPLLVGLAEPERPGRPADPADAVIAAVQQLLNVRFHPRASRVLPFGHAAGFRALHEARELLKGEEIAACIVAAVDSLINPATLVWLDRGFRLKTADNRDGVIPGEAAAAVLIQKRPTAASATEIVGLGFGEEKAHILSGAALQGFGLADAARAALAEAKLGLHQIDGRISDVTGELYGFKELPLVAARLMRELRQGEQPLWHWADAIGDTGAAAGVAQLVAVDAAFKKGYAPGDRMIGFTSSTFGARAAAVLRRRSDDTIGARAS
jgi:3-oxoacyl-[acyl-carrier-protein] synthase-1